MEALPIDQQSIWWWRRDRYASLAQQEFVVADVRVKQVEVLDSGRHFFHRLH